MTGDDDSMVVVVCARKVQLSGRRRDPQARKLESRQQLEVINLEDLTCSHQIEHHGRLVGSTAELTSP